MELAGEPDGDEAIVGRLDLKGVVRLEDCFCAAAVGGMVDAPEGIRVGVIAPSDAAGDPTGRPRPIAALLGVDVDGGLRPLREGILDDKGESTAIGGVPAGDCSGVEEGVRRPEDVRLTA